MPVHRLDVMWIRRAYIISFFTSGTDGGVWSASNSGCFIRGEGDLLPNEYVAKWTPAQASRTGLDSVNKRQMSCPCCGQKHDSFAC
jgi:hypothetical protein